MENTEYIKFSKEQIDKVGNSIIYFLKEIKGLSKTKILKLLYILDEISIKKSGIPFFNLKYKIWKFGPVSEEIFIDLSSDITMLKGYIEKDKGCDNSSIFIPKKEFNDDEFSDNDITLLNYVINEFGNKTTKELIDYTHRKNSLWRKIALEHNVLNLLEDETINKTEIQIDFNKLIDYDKRKQAIYQSFLESNA